MNTASRVRQLADEDYASVVALVQRLVRSPSRGGIDPYLPVLGTMLDWFAEHGLPARVLTAQGEAVGVVCDVVGGKPGPRYVLDACIDTAPFGDPAAWRHPPTSGVVEDGWLYGRGCADSKAAVAIFAHLAKRLWHQRDGLRGTLTVLLDADEHTGRFGGARAYFAGDGAPDDVAGVMIGYPGYQQLVVGGRGFLRARLTVRGRAGHTGSARWTGYDNAAEKAAQLVAALTRYREPDGADPAIGLAPRLTVTGIHGGQSYSVVPDRCDVDVDVRLTYAFGEAEARDLIQRLASGATVAYEESWPAYRLTDSAPIRVALLEAAERHLPRRPEPRVAGPSNIGNYLAGLGIDATAGLGVGYEALHGTDERIDLATIPMIQATYHDAILALLGR